MKFLKNIFTIIVPAVLMTSCDFLDCNESDYRDLASIQESFQTVKKFTTNIYGYLPSDFCSIDGAMLDAATDDAIHVYEKSDIQRFVDGTWAPNHVVNDVFAHYYDGIHDANFYLENLVGLKFEEWANSQNYESWMKDYNNYVYEVRFLRAYFYFELVRRYQNIPLITNIISQAEINNVKPTEAHKVLKFILDECTEIADELPVNYNNFMDKEFGRVTKGAALALKARTALYMASPLFNPNQDKAKWEEAAKAAYQIIGNASTLGYGLADNFENLFNAKNKGTKEVILCRPTGSNNNFESSNFPFGVTGGHTSTCPSDNLVAEFEMADGSTFDWNNPEMKADPYANRDPRMRLTIVHNNMEWPASTPVEIFEGGRNGQPLPNATKTGYYLRKYLNKEISFEPGAPVAKAQHNWILFRYAEVLLNYAEAMIQAHGDSEYTDAECKMSALQAINMVRQRKGVEMPKIASGLTADAFLAKVKHERRVEMAFEGQRFWDLRRWKELDNIQNIYGVKILKESNNSISYNRILVKKRNVSDKMYFYPFANTELFKNKNLVQNPGWK